MLGERLHVDIDSALHIADYGPHDIPHCEMIRIPLTTVYSVSIPRIHEYNSLYHGLRYDHICNCTDTLEKGPYLNDNLIGLMTDDYPPTIPTCFLKLSMHWSS